MAAFRTAEQLGADGIELDVHLSRDGAPVVIHDETVDRTSNGTGTVAAMRASELLDLDIGSWFDKRFAGERIPLLADVLAWAGDRLRINIEIKHRDAGQAVLELLTDFPAARVLISSFNHKLLFRLRQQRPDLPIGFLSDTRFWRLAMRRAVVCRAESFHPAARFCSRTLIAAGQRQGLTIYPWTVDSDTDKRRMLWLGVDGLFTNTP